jgi:hypothetical protein
MMMGYAVAGNDGEGGPVSDLLLDDPTRRVHRVVVDTRCWLPRREVLVSAAIRRGAGWPSTLRCSRLLTVVFVARDALHNDAGTRPLLQFARFLALPHPSWRSTSGRATIHGSKRRCSPS